MPMMAEGMGPLVTTEDLFLAFEHGMPAPDLLCGATGKLGGPQMVAILQ